MKKQINQIILNVDYPEKNAKLGDVLTFAEDKTEQVEAFDIVNSGIGRILEINLNQEDDGEYKKDK